MAFPTEWTLLEQIDIDITSLGLGGSLSDYPINIVSLTSDTFSNLESDGKDLRFTSDEAGNTELPFEIVSIDTSGETIECWVKITTLATTTTTIYAWGNYSSATAYARDDTYGSDNVWKSDYKAVYHLGESSGSAADSTSNAYDGTFNGDLPNNETGVIGDSQDLDGTDDYVSRASNSDFVFGTGAFTISVWGKMGIQTKTIISDGQDRGVKGVSLRARNDNLLWVQNDSLVGAIISHTYDYDDDEWHYFVIKKSGSTWTLNIDGGTSTGTGTNSDNLNGTKPLLIGAITDNNVAAGDLEGLLDEARIVKGTAFTDDWIKTDYNIQKNPSTYITNTFLGGSNFFLMF